MPLRLSRPIPTVLLVSPLLFRVPKVEGSTLAKNISLEPVPRNRSSANARHRVRVGPIPPAAEGVIGMRDLPRAQDSLGSAMGTARGAKNISSRGSNLRPCRSLQICPHSPGQFHAPLRRTL